MYFIFDVGLIILAMLLLLWVCSLYVRFIFRLKVIKDAPLFLDGEELRRRVLEAPDHVLPYAFVRGIVEADEDILYTRTDNPLTGVLLQSTVTETTTTYMQDQWVGQRRNVRWIYSSAVPFMLRYGDHNIRVVDAEEAEPIEIPAESVARRVNEQNTAEVWLGLLRRMLTVEDLSEKMLCLGAFVMVGGEVTVDADNTMQMGPSADWFPMIVTGLTQDQLVLRSQREMQEESVYPKITLAVTAIVCMVSFAVTDLLS